MRIFPHLLAVVLLSFPVAKPSCVRADEGMWLFNELPLSQLKSQYDFAPPQGWANHIMLSSVRFNSGGSASFVSSKGLVLTNHHVASDTLQKLSTPENNYMRDGFLARTPAEEIIAPDLELNQLVSIDDVTDKIQSAVPEDATAAEAYRARRAVMAKIEKESLDETGLRSDVVTLFGGAKYHLYRYKKYTDVRLVWAPETAAAFFGGDADNFEYPRYCLDVALFRVYENGQPAKVDHFLKYSAAGPSDGELVFVSGNPGRTQRIFTVAALEYLRDKRFPHVLNALRRLEILLQQYSFEGEEQKRRARDELFGVQNARKAYSGMLAGLQTPSILAKKAQQEERLLARIRGDERLRKYSAAWETIEQVQQRRAELLHRTASFSRRSSLYRIAETLVLMAAEDRKPSEDRLREFRDSARESLEQQLYSPAPIYGDLEVVKLGDAIAYFVEQRGGNDNLARRVLGDKSPIEVARECVAQTRLADIAVRRSIAAKDPDTSATSADPLIRLARTLESEYREVREASEELDELERQAYAQITEATIAVEGTSNYPDATFTLRLAFGVVKGYQDGDQQLGPWTTMGGAFEHELAHDREGDWKLPESWHRASGIEAEVPLNFVCTADIIGGNSGSPVLNRDGELVGVIFDGNRASLTADFMYSDQVGRAIAVHSSGIRHALQKIYGAEHLAHELGR